MLRKEYEGTVDENGRWTGRINTLAEGRDAAALRCVAAAAAGGCQPGQSREQHDPNRATSNLTTRAKGGIRREAFGCEDGYVFRYGR